MNFFSSTYSYWKDELSALPVDVVIFCILLVISVIVVDGLALLIEKLNKSSGLKAKTNTKNIDGGETAKTKEYISQKQGLAGRPDAIIEENGFIIPMEIKPFGKKVHERYIAQLFIYMRLIEEFEGKTPPYGYLILGPERKRIKIMNTPKKQLWLDEMLQEMRDIADGSIAHATPHPKKCGFCDVEGSCAFSMKSKETGYEQKN